MKISKNLQISLNACLEASNAILNIYDSGNFDIDYKENNSPLTIADKKAHEIIKVKLESTGYPILSEEGREISFEERKTWKKFWLVDPIDGTKEFINKNGEFTINIALIENNLPILGVVCAPAINQIYYAENGMGAFKSRLYSEIGELILNSSKLPSYIKNQKIRLVSSKSHLNNKTKKFIDKLKLKHGEIDIISKGSSLKFCLVAEGYADYYPRLAPTMEWDVAAGMAICLNSKCSMLIYNSKKKFIFNKEKLINPNFVVVSNKFK